MFERAFHSFGFGASSICVSRHLAFGFSTVSADFTSRRVFLHHPLHIDNTTDVDMGNALDFIKVPIEIKEHAPSTTGSGDGFVQLGHEANADNHDVRKMESFRKYPWACGWCIYAVWVVLLVSFENQAAGNVIGIPEFRKDFGREFMTANAEGEVEVTYVIDAIWQSAFQGAPVAS
jgi:hypothetical protein